MMDDKIYKDDQLLQAFFKSVPQEQISEALQARIMGQLENRKEQQLARRSELREFLTAVITSVVFLGIGVGVLFYYKILPFKFDFKPKFSSPELSLPQIDTGVLPMWIMIFVIAVLLFVGESYLARKYIK